MEKNRFITLGACLGSLILPIFIRDRLVLNILIICFYYAYLALCWNLVGGYAGVLSLGHGIFFGIGAYTSAALFNFWAISPWVGMIIGGILAAIGAFLIGNSAFSFGLKGFLFIVVTLSLTQIFQEVVKQFEFLGASEGIRIPLHTGWTHFQFQGKVEYYYIILLMLFMVILISFLIRRSRMGYSLLAIREDEDTAEASGINSKGCKNLIFTVSAFLMALGGSFYVQFAFFIDPETAFATSLNINLILAVVIGGIGTIWGPILGAFFFVSILELLRFLPMQSQFSAAFAKVIFALILMYVMIYCPKGILQLGLFRAIARVFSKKREKVLGTFPGE